MKVLFTGCSVTWGAELEDRLNQRYSKIVSDHYNIEEYNIALCGISNDAIVRRTIQWLENNNGADIVVLQMTVSSRREYIDHDGIFQKWSVNTIRRRSNPMMSWYYRVVQNGHYDAENFYKNLFLVETYCKLKSINLVVMQLQKKKKLFDSSVWEPLCEQEIYSIRDSLKSEWCDGGHPSAENHKAIAKAVIAFIDKIRNQVAYLHERTRS